jgi:hypothetical protein
MNETSKTPEQSASAQTPPPAIVTFPPNAEPKFRGDSDITYTQDSDGTTFFVRVKGAKLKDGKGFETKALLAPISMRYADLSTDIKTKFMALGAQRKPTADAALSTSGSGDKKVSASPQAKWAALNDSVSGLLNGLWEKASAGSSLSADTRLLIEAIAAVWKKPLDKVETRVRSMSVKEREKLMVDPDLKPTIDSLREARAKSAEAEGSSAADLKASLLNL